MSVFDCVSPETVGPSSSLTGDPSSGMVDGVDMRLRGRRVDPSLETLLFLTLNKEGFRELPIVSRSVHHP